MNIEAYNAAYLLGNPKLLRSVLCKPRAPRVPKVIVMSLKPKYAKAIYEGKKNWEFRKAPPPLFRRVYIYESAPVSAVTGWVYFSDSVTGVPLCVWDIVRTNRCYPKNLPGIKLEELKQYAGKRMVTALRVYKPTRADRPIEFDGRPPQNWGRFSCDYGEPHP